ncbi:MAG TPA: DUF1707 domain-containing protein [Streptosporangiaceae bacterium]|jgi:Domain of unknown function (DUF1707)|nr:DUF1707 domain-containing protein [Streptosporangiaceae bacterium]
MERAPRGYPQGDLRVSDADRDRALAELSEHFQAGRLTADELDERSGRALAARTGRELSGLFADLPRSQASVPGTAVIPGSGDQRLAPRPPAARIAVAALALAAIISVLSSGHHGHHGLIAVVPVIVALAIFGRLAGIGRQRGHDRGRV